MITSYEEMSVGVYCKIMDALNDTGASENDKTLALVSALTGLSVDDLLDEPVDEWRRQNAASAFVGEYPAPHAVRDAYTLRGVRYIPTLKESKMTAGQFIDFSEYLKREAEGEFWAEVLSVILVPEGKTYGKGYDVGEVQDAIRAELCILDAIALRAFFLTSCGLSAKDTLRYLEEAMGKMKWEKGRKRKVLRKMRAKITDLMASGAGWRTLTRWLNLPTIVGTQLPHSPQKSS